MQAASLNFVKGLRRQLVVVAIALCVAGVMLASAGIYALVKTEAYRSRIGPVEKRIAALKKERLNYRSALENGPTNKDIQSLSDRIELLSERLKLNGLWVGEIFHLLEKTVPNKAHLLQLHYPYEEETARIMLRAESEAVLSEALRKMEENENLSNIVLAGQSRETDGGTVIVADIRFSLRRPIQ